MDEFAVNLADHQGPVAVQQLTKHHLLITGQTGSGKTTTTLALLSKLQAKNVTTIVFDPTGEYTQLPNATVYRLGDNAYFDVGRMNGEQLVRLTGTQNELIPFVNRAIASLQIMQNIIGKQQLMTKINIPIKDYQEKLLQLGTWSKGYPVQLLPQQIIEEMIIPFTDERADYSLMGQQYDRQLIRNLWFGISQFREKMMGQEFRTLFGIRRTSKKPLIELGYVLQMFLNQASLHKTLVIDLSILKHYEDCQRELISMLLKQVLNYRLHHNPTLPVKIVIDEAHRYLPNEDRLFKNGIFQIAREGRKGNLSLILTTQSPLDLPNRLRSQFANLVIHHLADSEEERTLNLKGKQTATDLKVGEAFVKIGLEPFKKAQVNMPGWYRKENAAWHI